MKFSDYLIAEGLTEAATKKYFLIYHERENASGATFHNYYVWSTEDLKNYYGDKARGSTVDKIVDAVNRYQEKRSYLPNYLTVIGKVNGVDAPVSTSSEGIHKTKEKAELALKKLCPRAVSVLRNPKVEDEETNESIYDDKNQKAIEGALKSKYKGPFKFKKVLRAFKFYDEDYEDDPEYCTCDFLMDFHVPYADVGDMWDELDDMVKAAEKALKGVKVFSDEGTAYTITTLEDDPDGTTGGDPKTALPLKASLKK